ncbi:hypothetical protein [Nocardia veterana]|uniref:Uncharacterized protein n=1 Tax=Nocardia veterana TaxID=132249 RepID=A0A7X6RKQ3_9NOCA|nr:hypothetical protein [Nocardia veterana]NKY88928.1 hypothetical protein [Nocardia veterana]
MTSIFIQFGEARPTDLPNWGERNLLPNRMLGRKDPAVTLRVYADLFDSDLDKAAQLMHDNYALAA